MGVNLRNLVIKEEINLDDLSGKIIAIDSFNILFQFLTTIRAPDGNLLKDHKNRVTSHLIGLFSRTTSFMQKGIKPIFVFDGTPPKLKKQEIQRRKDVKLDASEKLKEAESREDMVEMRKYAARTTILTDEMINDAKELLTLLGLPVIQAPSEGEAQAAFIVKQGDAWAVGSQDYDSLLYGTDRLIQNLSIAGRRKKTRTLATIIVKPELIDLKNNLNNLKISNEQLIVLAMLVGTDYNFGGIKGIGPKNALKLVKQHGNDFNKLFNELKWNDYFNFSWQEVYEQFTKMPVEENYKIKFDNIQSEKLKDFLIDERDFGLERVEKVLNELNKFESIKKQKTLGDF